MGRKLSYQLFGGIEDKTTSPGPGISGLFQWANAFNVYGGGGRILATLARDLLEEVDWVHANVTPGSISYLSAIREALGKSSSTKVLANVDFALEMWKAFDPYVLRDQLAKADCVFHVESTGAARLSKWLGRNVTTQPHPIDIEGIQKFREEENKEGKKYNPEMVQEDNTPVIACQYHRYDKNWELYFYPTTELRKEGRVRTALMGMMPDDRFVPMNSMFDDVIMMRPFQEHLRVLARCTLNLDMTYMHTYGRGVVEAAALEVPTLGTNSCEAQIEIWPEFAFEAGAEEDEIESVIKNALDLEVSGSITDLAKQGRERCEYYGLEKSYERMRAVLEEVK